MQRLSNIKKPTFILSGDWHLREDQPICRTDDFWEAQWKKVDFVASLQKQFGCQVLHGGDLFHISKPSPYLLSMTSQHLPDMFVSVYGNHDLQNHSLQLANKSGIYNLMINGRLSIPQNGHYGQSLGDGRTGWIVSGRQITIQHVMAYQTPPYPGATGGNAKQFLQKYSQYDLILTSDNHIPFVEEYEGRILVNPGSLTRQTAAQIDHKPRVYLYYAETNTVEPIYLPIEDVISREHIEVKEERDSRLEAFIEHLNEDWDTTLSFEDNLKAFKDANNISEDVMNIIYKAINT